MLRLRNLVWACALAAVLAAPASAANAWLSLNLDFNTPGDTTSGGTWLVVGKADERGLAGVSLNLQNINFNASGFLAPAAFEVREFGTFGTRINIVQGDDMEHKTLDIGVIGGPFPSSYVDPVGLVPFGSSVSLGSFTGGVPLATGTFNPGVVPNWTASSEANVFLLGPGNPPASAATWVGAATQMTVQFVAVPEPATIGLAGCGLLALAAVRRFRA